MKTGKTILVTGSTDGIGKQTAIELARAGARVIVHGRSRTKAETARAEVVASTGSGRIEAIDFDLSSLAAIRQGAESLLARQPLIDVVIHNAGVYMHERVLSVDGQEMSFAVNHLAPFYLTHLLRGALERAALEHQSPARVVTVSSIAHMRGKMHWEDLSLDRHFDGYEAYAQSKLANILFAYELARRSDKKILTSTCLHPGVIDTKLLRSGFGARGASLEEGAATSVYLAISKDVEGVTARYYAARREAPVARQANDKEAWKKLWEMSAAMCDIAVA